MKKVFVMLVNLCLVFTSLCQIPIGFRYQAVVRNEGGEPLQEQAVSVRITLHNADGTYEYYQEQHNVITTPSGQIAITVGKGNLLFGEMENVPWLQGGVYMNVELDPNAGSNYATLGAVELMAVPYALYAQSATSIVTDPNAGEDDPLFMVRNSVGQIVFAVYQGGVRAYVDDTGGKQTRGGFAIGG